MRCAYCDLNDACLDRETDTPICLYCAERIWSPAQFKAAYMQLGEAWQAAPLRERRDCKVVTPAAIRYGGLEIVADGSDGAGLAPPGALPAELNDNDLLEAIYQWSRSAGQPATHVLHSGLVAQWRPASENSADVMIVAVAIGDPEAKSTAHTSSTDGIRSTITSDPTASRAIADALPHAEQRPETRPAIH